EFTSFLERVNQAVSSYQELGDRAVSLVDRYFDRLPDLTTFLEKIQDLESQGLETLRKELNPTAWKILSQLTDGDPLGFLLKQVSIGGKKVDSLQELQKRAGAVQDLLRNAAHEELLKLITQAKESFGIDKFFTELG